MTVYINGIIQGGGSVSIPTDELQSQVFEVADITARDALPTGTSSGQVWIGDVVIVADNGNGLREAFKFNGVNYVSTVQPEDITVRTSAAVYNVTNEKMVITDASANNINVILPDAVSLTGYVRIYIIRTDSSRTYTVTVTDSGGNLIDSSASRIVPVLGAYEFILDATNNKWFAR